MRTFRDNLASSVMNNRLSEFRLLVDQSRDDLFGLKFNRENKNLANFLAEEHRLDFFQIVVDTYQRTAAAAGTPPGDIAAALRTWLDEPDSLGLTALFTAVYAANLVE